MLCYDLNTISQRMIRNKLSLRLAQLDLFYSVPKGGLVKSCNGMFSSSKYLGAIIDQRLFLNSMVWSVT